MMTGMLRTGVGCLALWQMVALELKLVKNVTSDKEGPGHPLLKIGVETIPEVVPRKFYVLSADIKAHANTGGCLGWQAFLAAQWSNDEERTADAAPEMAKIPGVVFRRTGRLCLVLT